MTQPKIQKVYPLTPMQEGMLYHAMLEPDSSSYFTQLELELMGELDVALLEQSVDYLIRTYDILRTVFVHQQLQRPRQIVLGERKAEVYFENIAHLQPDRQQQRLASFKRDNQAKGFHLAKDLLLRIAVFQLTDSTYHLIWSNHHILLDGWSLGVLMKRLFENYEALRSGLPLPGAIEKPYADYIKWLEKQDKDEAYAYWEQALADFEQPASVPHWNHSAAANAASYVSEEVAVIWQEEQVQALTDLAGRYQVTLPNLLQAMWGLLLGKFNNTNDVVFGTVVSGRPSAIPGIESMVGLFINTVPMRLRIGQDAPFSELMQTMQQAALAAEPYDYVPLYEIQKRTALKQHLVNHLVAFENYPLDQQLKNGTEEQRLGFAVKVAGAFEQTNYDFNLIVHPAKQWTLKLMYNAVKYDNRWVKEVAGHLTHLAKLLVRAPETTMNQLQLLTDQNKKLLLRTFNATKADYPRESTIGELFEKQVELTPDHLAIVFKNHRLTYGELNAKANRLAKWLRTNGVQPNTVVGIMVEQSIDMFVGIMAILKAGGAYLPIDPDNPDDRVNYILQDSAAAMVLTSEPFSSRLQGYKQFDIDSPSYELLDSGNLMPVCLPNDLAYVMYTSGSTGRPKGVMVSQRNVVRLVKNAGYIPFHDKMKMAQTGAISFDASTFEIFGALLHGASLHPVPKSVLLDAAEFAQFLRWHNITTMWLTSPLFNQLAQKNANMFASVQHLIIGGDALSPKHVNQVRNACPELSLWNGYGPTENTTFSTCFLIEKEYTGHIPIGKPLGHSSAYILDASNQLQPVGIPGQLCVGGDGVALGYLHRQDLTKEKFVDNPYAPGERMYLTGDLARWLPDGNIEFLGRMDHQVKVRGFRIELGEIESELLQVDKVDDAAVMTRQDEAGQNYICAYFTGALDLSGVELRSALLRTLPEYMVPAVFIQLEKLPLTPNGKVDRRALPEPDASLTGGIEYAEPVSEQEKLLCEIWQEVLGAKPGIDDDFFAVGGHSLNAMMLSAKIHQKCQVELPIKTLFERPTIRRLAVYLEEMKRSAERGRSEISYAPIEKAPYQNYYPVSSAQSRMYILNQLEEASISYNIPAVLLLEGELDRVRLEAALQQLVNRHEILRTSFELADGRIVQRINEHASIPLNVVQAAESEAQVIISEFIRPFALHQAPLVRAKLVELAEFRHLLLIDMHHIISDGTSMGLFVRDLTQLYDGASLPEPKLHYKDFAVWQHAPEQQERLKQLEQYWLDCFAGEIPMLDLPTDFPRPEEQNFAGERFVFGMDEMLTKQIQRLTAETGTTMYMFLLAVFKVFLSKYANQEQIIVGSPAAGRTHADTAAIPGMFINTLALQSRPEGAKTFKAFLLEVKEASLQAFDHQDYPFEQLVEQLPLVRDTKRSALFNVMFHLQNAEMPPLVLGNLHISPYSLLYPTVKFDLKLEAFEHEGAVSLSFEYASALYQQETIRRWSGHLLQLVKGALDNPESLLSELSLLSEEETTRMLEVQRGQRTDAPANRPLHRLFEERVQLMPEHIAVVCGEKRLTYSELNEQANRLASILRKRGVARNQLVALLVDRTEDMIISILATMKAGGAFLPIDPEIPAQRMLYILEDSGAGWLVTQREHLQSVAAYKGEVVDLRAHQLQSEPTAIMKHADVPDPDEQVNDLAYVIYTSGTTGLPKGVQLGHRGLVNYAFWFMSEANVTALDKTVLLSSFAFDLGYTSLFPVLLAGGELHIVASEIVTEPDELSHYLYERGITYLKLTPSLFHLLVHSHSFLTSKPFASLRLVVLGGERIHTSDLALFHAQYANTELMNHYGPTESTIGAIAQYIDTSRLDSYAQQPTIGQPIYNAAAYVLGAGNQLVPAGVVGELHLSGPGLAHGYLNQPELTAERFMASPFAAGELLYKTGDLVRQLPDEKLAYIGRVDDQVKIRGYRIELGEIEMQLLEHEPITKVVVMPFSAEGQLPELCAYYSADQELTVSDLRDWLTARLPSYMVPTRFIRLNVIPLTSNGKVDRRLLPAPEPITAQTRPVLALPNNELEHQLCLLWKEVLGIEAIGTEDSFFDLGGHSLKAIMLISNMQNHMNRKVPLKVLFEQPTIRQLARYMEEAAVTVDSLKAECIAPAQIKAHYPVSSAQKRMYILHQLEPESISYNMPSALLLEGELELGRLEKALAAMIDRHETLRTSFAELDGTPVQMVHASVDFQLNVLNTVEEQMDETIRQFIRPFDLNKAPLLRAGVIQLNNQQHLLLIDMHHIIADGISRSVFIKELAGLHAGEILEKPELHYKDYTVWNLEPGQQQRIGEQEQYWLEQFQQPAADLHLPTDFPRPAVQSFAGDLLRFDVPEATARQLRKLALDTGTTLHMALLAAFSTFLARISGQEDIVIGSAVTGRTTAEVQTMPGMFVNTLALRFAPEHGKTFKQLLAEAKETCLRALENQSYPFEELVNKLDLPRDMSRNPLFNVMLTVELPDKQELQLERLTIAPYETAHRTAKFDLTLGAFESPAGMGLQLEYATDLFSRETIACWSVYILRILQAAALNPDIVLSEIEMLAPAEQQLILHTWNDTGQAVPQHQTIHELFEAQALRTPDHAAVVYKGQQWTYHELNARANLLARQLIAKGIYAEQPVGIMVKPSLAMAAGVLAILKAGGAFVPIDPDYPEPRITYMLADSGAKVLLTQAGITVPAAFRGEVMLLSDEPLSREDEACLYEEPNPAATTTSDKLAYIIYTSGTTGQPKGVMIEHRSLVNLCFWHNEAFEISDQDRSAKYAGFGFDATVWEMFPYWIAGAQIHMIEEAIRMDVVSLNAYFEQHRITVTFLPTQLCEQFMELDNDSLRILLTGGDKLKRSIATRYCLINNYGPTESTVVATSMRIESGAPLLPIGRPIGNTRIYILGNGHALQPQGVAGEICIAGRGLARGYWNLPEETARKFVSNPYNPNERIYRTGDLGRWLEDGSIEYLGRIDHQVKVRGYRIELAEIEAQLTQLPTVKASTVAAVQDAAGHTSLCAYIVPAGAFDFAQLRTDLAQRLPEYMIPPYWVHLDSLPVTPNGKVDRRALPVPSMNAESADYKEPRNELERFLASIWQDVLGAERVGISDNFFTLGGDSIKAIQMASRLYKHGWKLEMKHLFQHPAIEQVSPYLQWVKGQQVEQGPVEGEAQLTPIQQWFFEQSFINPHHWNQSIMLHAPAGWDTALIRTTMNKITEHHDALRMNYAPLKNTNEYRQLYRDVQHSTYTLEVIHLEDASNAAAAVARHAEQVQRSIDLTSGPLVKLVQYKTPDGDHLLIIIHHLVIDGVSWRILLEDFASGYAQAKQGQNIVFQEKTNSYKDWAAGLAAYADSEAFLKQADYWRQIERMSISPLPSDNVVRERKAKDSAAVSIELSNEETLLLLTDVHRPYGTEINDILLTAVGLAIHQWTNGKAIGLNLEGHGREEIISELNVSRTVGWFSAQYPIVLNMEHAGDLPLLIKTIKENQRQIPDKGIGYGMLRYLSSEKHKSGLVFTLKPEISFNYLGQFDSEVQTDLFSPSVYDMGAQTSPESEALYALSLSGMVRGGRLVVSCAYNKKQYMRATIDQLMDRFHHHLLVLIQHCTAKTDRDFTPSDFTASELQLEEVGDIFDMLAEKFG
ncbi:non-ribosomal peptide synthetase [Paenibacillus sp. BIHB 4019]|uniref:Non-ribosomal peptide synthetase n=1 Tax=Paenibacillus sp. BIHB 4019 TaxID=1870819 RepID=A0A1B2DNW6_9BACL|nr:non-ribosomal peptide synthetase [Paenibacillus sp. BIHB 4019]ANY69397.1 non-ribosomal peptide synthetase [Paenibacillus sp. BIHB 4019]